MPLLNVVDELDDRWLVYLDANDNIMFSCRGEDNQ